MSINRIQSGVPAGGQFAPVTRLEPALTLTPGAFDATYDATRGQETLKALQDLPDVGVRATVNASRVSDLLRDSYGEYWEEGVDPQSRAAAVKALQETLPNLPGERRDRFVEMIGFAVHEEMKHYRDHAYAENVEHDWELLVDRDDYATQAGVEERATEDNREQWAFLADRAACHALSENNSHSAVQQAAAA